MKLLRLYTLEQAERLLNQRKDSIARYLKRGTLLGLRYFSKRYGLTLFSEEAIKGYIGRNVRLKADYARGDILWEYPKYELVFEDSTVGNLATVYRIVGELLVGAGEIQGGFSYKDYLKVYGKVLKPELVSEYLNLRSVEASGENSIKVRLDSELAGAPFNFGGDDLFSSSKDGDEKRAPKEENRKEGVLKQAEVLEEKGVVGKGQDGLNGGKVKDEPVVLPALAIDKASGDIKVVTVKANDEGYLKIDDSITVAKAVANDYNFAKEQAKVKAKESIDRHSVQTVDDFEALLSGGNVVVEDGAGADIDVEALVSKILGIIETSSKAGYVGTLPSEIIEILKAGKKCDVIYVRVGIGESVSMQLEALRKFVGESKNPVIELVDIGSGVNFERTKTKLLIKLMLSGKVGTVYAQSADRFSYNDYELFSYVAELSGVDIKLASAYFTSEDEALSYVVNFVDDMLYRLDENREKAVKQLKRLLV